MNDQNKTANKVKALDIFDNDFKIAEEQKGEVNGNIEKWNDLYDGKGYGNETENHSAMVWKMVQKQGETLMANLAKPFISGDQNIIVSPVTSQDIYKSKIDQGLLNHYHDKVLDKNRFYKDLSRVMVKEGTAWIRVGWKKVNKRKSIEVGNMPFEQEQRVIAQGFEVVRKDGKTFIEKDNVTKNEPEAVILKNGRVFTDPIATTHDDLRFLIYEYETDIGTLKSQSELYDEEAIKKIEDDMNSVSSTYYSDLQSAGVSSQPNRNFEDKARKKIKVYEWWGDFDIDNDNVPVPCVMTITSTKGGKEVLSIRKNPYAFKKIPFVSIPCITDLYSVWGKAIAHLIEDIQYIYTMLMRGVLDNAAGSNNAQKFVKKGALDTTNYRRMINKEPVVEVNTTEHINQAVMDGGFNQIPSSIFNLFGMLDQEAEAMTGISKMMQGVSGAHMQAAASNFSATLSMSQIRLIDITHNVAYGMKNVLKMWIAMALDYLDEEEIKTITGIDIDHLKVKETNILIEKYGINELPEDVAMKAQMIIMEEVDDMFNKEDLDYDIRLKVGTDGVKEVRINQLNMLMQQMGALSGMVDPTILKDLLAEYAELMDFQSVAEKIREFVPQPDPRAIQAQEIELAEKAAQAKKDDALAENALARSEQIKFETSKSKMSADADVANKYADVATKYSEIDNKSRDMDTKESTSRSKAVNDRMKVENDRAKLEKERSEMKDAAS